MIYNFIVDNYIKLFILVHDWYPQTCCAEKHCHPVPCSELLEQADGSWVWQGYTFMNSLIAPSQDALCHVCTQGTLGLCAFVQMNT